ncbi:MAG TPA: dethiobiotin synthase [Accumulibacter sp.]|nr:dethiobiotin synthase [Accumulibacter sp.]
MNSRHAWFITGTDTEIGKTHIACVLLHTLRNAGYRTLAMKPVAAGTDVNGLNDDVERLLAACTETAAREMVNPYLFAAAIAPHIAAVEEGRRIEATTILAAFQRLQALADAVIVEGVGGFCVPLNEQLDTADLATALQLPVILVVGMRLGCINHALLTAQAIVARGLPFAGWVANCIDPAMARLRENLDALQSRLPAPLIGIVAHGQQPLEAACALRLPPGTAADYLSKR